MEYHWCTNEKCLLETDFYKTAEELQKHMNVCGKEDINNNLIFDEDEIKFDNSIVTHWDESSIYPSSISPLSISYDRDFVDVKDINLNEINKGKINPEMIKLLKYYNRNFIKVITIDEYKNYIKNIKFVKIRTNISKQINNYTLYYNRGYIALQTPNKVLINFIIKNKK